MANLTNETNLAGVGQDTSRRFHVPVDAATTIYAGGMVSTLTATGMLVPTTTSGAGPCIGKATHTTILVAAEADGDRRCLIETDRVYALTNGAGGQAFSAATPIGAPCFAIDDNSVGIHSAAATLQQCGVFYGFEADGKVRVYISAAVGLALGGTAMPLSLQVGSGTLSSGVLAVATGIRVSAASKVFAAHVTGAGTQGDYIRVPAADRTVGEPGTGALTFRSFLDGAAATSDTSTFEYLIVG
jgi:hypothetical protein